MLVRFDWSIVYGFTSRSRIFHLYGDVTIAGEGLQNWGLCSALRAFEQGLIFIVPHPLWHETSVFSVLIRRTAPLSRLLRHTRGCGGSILTQTLTGIHEGMWWIYSNPDPHGDMCCYGRVTCFPMVALHVLYLLLCKSYMCCYGNFRFVAMIILHLCCYCGIKLVAMIVLQWLWFKCIAL
jgi:hypothetical protein